MPRSLARIFVKNRNFASGSKTNRALFWGNDPKFILMMKNSFQQYIIWLYFNKSFSKSHFFRDKPWKISIKVCLVLCSGQPRFEIRIWEHFWTYFYTINPMMVLKLANELPLKITFFEVSTIVLVCVKFQYLDIWCFVLETKHTPRLVLISTI